MCFKLISKREASLHRLSWRISDASAHYVSGVSQIFHCHPSAGWLQYLHMLLCKSSATPQNPDFYSRTPSYSMSKQTITSHTAHISQASLNYLILKKKKRKRFILHSFQVKTVNTCKSGYVNRATEQTAVDSKPQLADSSEPLNRLQHLLSPQVFLHHF